MDAFRDSSALVAVTGHGESVRMVVRGLCQLSHRGVDAASVMASDSVGVRGRSVMGAPVQLKRELPGQPLRGERALGMVYGWSTALQASPDDLEVPQRLVSGRLADGEVAVGLCGHLTNGSRLRRELLAAGAVLSHSGDSELLLHLVAQSRQRSLVLKLVDALWRAEGAFSVVLLTQDALIVARDPHGFRPLWVGSLSQGMAVCSDDVALRALGANAVREVAPGELLVLDARGETSAKPLSARPRASCVQELLGVARPESVAFGPPAWTWRQLVGERLAAEQACQQAELVSALPEAEALAAGYALGVGLPFVPAFTQSVAGRFGEPRVDAEVEALPAVVRNKRLVLVLSALLTGDAVQSAVRELRAAGAAEVHLRVASPAVRAACVYGVASPTSDELLSAQQEDLLSLGRMLGVETVAFLSREGLAMVTAGAAAQPFCTACLGDKRPVRPEEADDQLPLF